MNILSKNKIKFKVGEREYRTAQWNVLTTMLEAKRLGLVISTCLAAPIDMMMNSGREASLDDIIEGEDDPMMLTAAISQLQGHLTDDHFVDLMSKLMSNLEFRERDEEGDLGDFINIGEDWTEHFVTFGEDFDTVLWESFKVNLYDFFMKQGIVRSNIEKVLTVLKPIRTKLEKSLNEGTN